MKKVLTISFIALFCFTGFAFAQSDVPSKRIKEKVVEKKREIDGKRCEIVQERVENRVELFRDKQEKQLTAFTKIKIKLQRFVDRMAEKGYDTTELSNDLVEYDVKVKQFSSDYDLYLKLLSETKTSACNRSSVEFKANLRAARAQLKVVKDDAVELKTFYAKTVRPNILALKEQKLEVENEATNEDE